MPKNFETALKDLTQLVDKMESGNFSLEELLTQFEKGVSLVNHCQSLLKNAEQRIEMYSKEKNALVGLNLNDDVVDSQE